MLRTVRDTLARLNRLFGTGVGATHRPPHSKY
jgi:hypothetical protein